MQLVVSDSPVKGTLSDQVFSRVVTLMQRTVVQWVDALRNPQREPPSAVFTHELRKLGIDADSLHWGSMTFLPYRAEYLVNEIIKQPPRLVLEVGAGLSTLLFAALGARYGFSVFSLENYAGSVGYVRHLLDGTGLDAHVQLQVCGLVRKRYPDGHSYWWYGADLAQAQSKFDFVFIDGPMKTLVGRNGALPEVAPYLAEGNRIFMDDSNMEGGKRCLREWKEYFPSLEIREECFGVARLHLPSQS
jgi:predicted O-methyltransferase YrrM